MQFSKLTLADPTISYNVDFNIAIGRSQKLPHHGDFPNIGFYVTLISLKLLKLSLTISVAVPQRLVNLLKQLINETEVVFGDNSK